MTTPAPDPVRLGRDVCGVLDGALRREWLVTDGRGSFGCGTVAGGRTRRYHGLLVAATAPPLGRVVTAAGLSEAVSVDGAAPLSLHTQEWASGAVSPRGFELVESFELEGLVPLWRYALPGAVLEKRIVMRRGAAGGAATFVVYSLARAVPGVSLRLQLRPLCTWRDYHALTRAGDAPDVEAVDDGVAVRFGGGASPYWVRASGAVVESGGDWYRDLHVRVETERGMDGVEDLYAAGCLTVDLEEAMPRVALSISLDPDVRPADAVAALAAEAERATALLARVPALAPPGIARLVLAADQFVVDRGGLDTVLAGYPWFEDWGRDTMISLPGLALATGRPDVSAGLLRGFARFVDGGLLPNRFVDGPAPPEYNTADATLWYVEALRAHHAGTGDDALVRELWPVLCDILQHHVTGTRHGIGVDQADGLLRAGEPGLQLTWMDARVGDWVVTPRIGKPVEINALWHNALCSLEAWSAALGLPLPPPVDVAALRGRVAAAFDRYWNPQERYLFDVLDGPDGVSDPAVRPNAVIAAAVHHTPLPLHRIAAIVVRAQRDLLTSLGLRSLAPSDPAYVAHYGGGVRARDGAYHQGTVWPWLIGPFATAHLRAFGDPAAVRGMLAPLLDHLRDAGVGSISEIADADPPHTPRGCPWQAWSVAEVLRAWRAVAGDGA
ncbi:MAG TPA: amylo-alpha-1,6-glucosidase [Candidatus Dormibacteraeota bacterium]|nr:amylo-alpha-1,6-glucosidase [Candidatus Dormibacteraeota bacterium]